MRPSMCVILFCFFSSISFFFLFFFFRVIFFIVLPRLLFRSSRLLGQRKRDSEREGGRGKREGEGERETERGGEESFFFFSRQLFVGLWREGRSLMESYDRHVEGRKC